MKLFNTNELGRSMVEMLGTLAIMGVLSIGGIAGYTAGMNNHRANEALEQARRLAVMVSSQRMLGQSGTLSASDKSVGAYTFDQVEDANKIVLTVELPKAVFDKLDKMDGLIADISATPVAGDDSKRNVRFEFTNDLSGKPSEVISGQGEGSVSDPDASESEEGQFDPNDSSQCAEGYYPQGECNKQCTGNTKVNSAQNGCECKDDYVLKDGTCIACPMGSGTDPSYEGQQLDWYGYPGCTCIHRQDVWWESLGRCVSMYTCENDGDTCVSSEYYSGSGDTGESGGTFEGVCFKGHCCAGTEYAFDYYDIIETGPCCELAGGEIEYQHKCCNSHGFDMNTQQFTSTCCDAVSGEFYQQGTSVGGYEAEEDVCCVNYDDQWGNSSEFCQATNPNS